MHQLARPSDRIVEHQPVASHTADAMGDASLVMLFYFSNSSGGLASFFLLSAVWT